jgi:transcriptional regulator with XRE-family HTH domain
VNHGDVPAKTDPIDAVIARNVRSIRAGREERQVDLASRLGWSPSVVADLEKARRRVTMADMLKLCKALEVDQRELLRGVPEEDLRVLGLDRRRT